MLPPAYPEGMLRGLAINQPNQVWVCDIITYRELAVSRFAYLFLLMDLFFRFIVGWHVSHSLAADGAVDCVRMALKKLPKGKKELVSPNT